MFRNALAVGVGISLLTATGAGAQPACVHEDTLASHVGHAMWCWDDTPHNRGLLVTALVEGAIALKYAKLATADPGDLEAMFLNLGYVINALNPEAQPEGEALGYGLILAAEGAAVHIGFALDAETMFASGGSSGDGSDGYGSNGSNGDDLDAAIDSMLDETGNRHTSDYLVAEAEIAKLSLANAAAWSAEAQAAAESARGRTDAAEAAADAEAVLAAVVAVMRGRDVDGDGTISPENGEGGLNQAHEAMMAIIADQELTAPSAPTE